ncbi:MAG: L,D-transpeptidase [Bdellovibrionales bacterium]
MKYLKALSFLIFSPLLTAAQTNKPFDLLEPQTDKVGYRSTSHSFEVISEALTPALEEDNELFILINSAEGPTPQGALIPNQHMLVVKKKAGQKYVFKRGPHSLITGVKNITFPLSNLTSPLSLNNKNQEGLPFEWNDLEVLPVSTGTTYHMPTFSGIYQINWKRSQRMHEPSINKPMSNQVYIGYYYHEESIPRSKWSNKNRERISYAALHGTPASNWSALGRSRASHGCARMHPAYMKTLYDTINQLPAKKVLQLDWNYSLPTRPLTSRSSIKPVLVIIFNGYKQKHI